MAFAILNEKNETDSVAIFIDIPLTGGDAIHHIINNHYNINYLNFGIYWSCDIPIEQKKRIEVIRGHENFGIHKCLPHKKYTYMTMLRDPIERVISTFYYIRATKECIEHDLFNQITLYDYVTRKDLDYLTCNLQTRYLSDSYSDNLESAKYNLKNFFNVVGIAERLNDTLFIIEKELSWKVDNYKNINTLFTKQSLSEIDIEIINIIKEKNQNDIMLYNFASTLLDEKIQSLNKTKKIIVNIPFNICKLEDMSIPYDNYGITPECLTQEWIDYRINIFMNFTLKSLKAQTNQDFFTFIRYSEQTKNIIKQALENYSPLPNNIKFVTTTEYNNIVKEIIKTYDYLYEVTLSSDDMYHKSFIQQLVNYKPKPDTQVLICQNGYIYDSIQNRMAKYFNYSSTFNCFVYSVKDYLSGKRYDLNGFESAIKLPYEIIEKPNYINHSHKINTAFLFDEEITRWPKANGDVWINNQGQLALFGEEIIDKNEIKNILREFIDIEN